MASQSQPWAVPIQANSTGAATRSISPGTICHRIGSIAVAAEGAAFAIPLAGLIDIAEEKSRLQKALDKLAKEIGGLKGRLDNPNFVRSAPEDVVIEAQSNLEARQEEAAKVQEALKRLSDLG